MSKNLERKPFNLEEFLKNTSRPVVTRDGRPVRIICTDRIWTVAGITRGILALIKNIDGQEFIVDYDNNGKAGNDNNFDLFLIPIRKKGYINLYKINNEVFTSNSIYDSRESAMNCKTDDCIDTVEINWEE